MTEEVTEMPRSFSSAIQSEVAWRAALRPFTEPAIWIAPPNSNSFSVSVVLPASGWEMMAKVRRRAASLETSDMGGARPVGRLRKLRKPTIIAASLRHAFAKGAGAVRFRRREVDRAGWRSRRRRRKLQLALRAEHAERQREQLHVGIALDREMQVRRGAEAGIA